MATSWLFWAVSIVAALLFLGVNRVYVLLFTPALLGICYIFDQFVATPKGVHVFIDNSNIFIGAQNFDGYQDNQIRLNYTGLAKLLEKDRNVVTRLLAGSTPPSSEKAWDFARQAGYNVDLLRRVKETNKEQAVDDRMHAKILMALCLYNDPQILVLVTGDGNDNGGHLQTSFPQCVEMALQKGWEVELYAWRNTRSKVYYPLESRSNGRLKLIDLDDFKEDITFREKWKPKGT